MFLHDFRARLLFTLIFLPVASVVLAEQLPSKTSFEGRIAKEIKNSTPHWAHEPVKAPPGVPNIVLIMLDDVGFGDTSTFGGAANTPALDQLANRGLRYNQFHTTGLCAPTRAALLSGRNHHRVGFGGFGGVGYPGYDGVWKESAASIAEVLRRYGYSTAAFGKWHNTPLWEMTPYGPFDRWPTGLGFQYYYGNMVGMSSQWEPSLWRNTTPVQQPTTPENGYHYTTDITNEAIGWIRTQESLAPENPYMVYFAPGAAHAPHHVPREWIEQYRGRFDGGWDKLREEIFARQKKLGVIPADAELTPRPSELPAWDSLSREEKKLFARQMEIYAAFISHTDYEVGRLIHAVDEGKKGKNTLIIYIVGDNGAEAMSPAGTDGISSSVKDQLSHLDQLGGREYSNMYAAAWAWAGNTPFQWAKGIVSHFGGTRNPLVISWPARIRSGGEVRTQFTHVIDIVPTLYDVIGIERPASMSGTPQQELDGISFADTFNKRDALSRRRVQYFEMQGNRAIYSDGWVAAARNRLPWDKQIKLRDPSLDRWELYRVDKDFSQAHDVAEEYPDKLKELQRLFDAEAKKNDVYPLGAPLVEFRRPEWQKGRREFVYYGGFPGIPLCTGAVPDFLTVSHRIVAEADIPAAGAEGVILAVGGRLGGFSVYLKDGRLVYENNVPGRESEILTSKISLPTGKVQLVVELERKGEEDGGVEARLFVDGLPAGRRRLSGVPVPDFFDNFDVGQDSAGPVSNAYRAPFRFSGSLGRVLIELN